MTIQLVVGCQQRRRQAEAERNGLDVADLDRHGQRSQWFAVNRRKQFVTQWLEKIVYTRARELG